MAVLDNDLLDLWLEAGLVGLDTERARKLIEDLQGKRDAEDAGPDLEDLAEDIGDALNTVRDLRKRADQGHTLDADDDDFIALKSVLADVHKTLEKANA